MTDARVAQTHISTLFFTDDRVFKLLKPVVNGFLDHRDASVRCDAATRELELNARICPDVYLGTADVIEHGQLADRMIVMQRLPADRSVSHLLRNGQLTVDHVREIAKLVARFHASLPGITPETNIVETHRTRWTENIDETTAFVGPVLDVDIADRIEELAGNWLASHSELLEQRVTDGYIRDGHGDLLADDIFCMDDGPKILDCLAFRDDFRLVDVLDDIAFLAMDLHRLAGPRWAQLLMHYYHEFSAEQHPGSLAHYYLGYRAHVRSKVACLRWADGDLEQARVAAMYQRLALDHLERARLRMVMIGGGPATGKTTLAHALGDQLGCPVLSTDEIRKDLAGVDRTTHLSAKPDVGIYAPAYTEATYEELLRQAELLLRQGESVVLDASWSTEHHRDEAIELAEELGAEVIPLECQLPTSIAKERLIRRYANPLAVSDATPEIIDHLRSTRDPWPDAIGIDTNQPFLDVEADALTTIRCFGRAIEAELRQEGESFWGASVMEQPMMEQPIRQTEGT